MLGWLSIFTLSQSCNYTSVWVGYQVNCYCQINDFNNLRNLI